MDLHIHSRCSCYLFFFFLPGYPLSRSVSNARYVTSRVPAYKEVKDVWKCSCSNIYIHVYSLPLAFFAILYLSLPSSRSRHQLFQYFFFFSVPRERRPSGGNYLSILLERSFPFRREICRYSHLREIRLVSWISRIQCKNYSKLFIYISKRRFEECSLVISSISTLTVIWSRVSVARRLNFRRTFIAARIRFDL